LQPKIKQVKKLELSEGLGAGTLQARLVSAGIGTEPYPIDLELDVRDVSVRRDFMRSHYRGSPPSTFPAIVKIGTQKRAPIFHVPESHTKPRLANDTWGTWVILQRSWMLGPRVRCRVGDGNIQSLDPTQHPQLLYMGEYSIRPADSLTKVEWADQTCAVRIFTRLFFIARVN
jgi:hypothetical protein